MSIAIVDLVHILSRGLNTTDPKVGSARDNSTSPSLGRVTSPSNSASFAVFFSTLIPVSVYAAVCFILFFIGRHKFPRVYSPRTFLSSLEPHERARPLPHGWFKWMKTFWNTPDTDVLNYGSLDGYLFLRYLRILCVICSVGCLLTWPILIPIHSIGKMGNKQLDKLTFGNVSETSMCYVHAIIAWVFFGFVMYMVARESVFFINIRQAYLLSPFYANRLSSRTVLFTCVPGQILNEKKLRRVFGDSVKNVWIPRECEDLEELVNEREQTAERLEKAEIQLIKKANKAYQYAIQHGGGNPELPVVESARELNDIKESKGVDITTRSIGTESPTSPREGFRGDGTPILNTNYGFTGPPPGVNGSVAAQWIPASHRPHHRPIANWGRRVDTIHWTRNRLKALAPKISKLRRDYKKGKGRPVPATFIEFHTQVDAQSAYQTLAHHRANHMRAEIVGVRPHEIIWNSMYFRWWERIIRRFLVQGGVAAMVIFFSVPSAFVGSISNVKSLTDLLPFLSFINKLPAPILGLISGLLPALALALLMAIVPTIMRACARQAGVVTESRIELFVQSSYFVFQVVQVFLVTTITSAASSAVQKIIKDPLSARDLLSQNLPTASNFYISYFILQGFAFSATRIVHLGSIFRHQVLGNSGSNPRFISRRYHRLRRIHWGSIYPVVTNMGVIAITYSIIAPVILGVALLGLFVIYLSYRWNLLYVYSSERDIRGLCYPRALSQTLTGVYLAEICLAGLFGIKGAFGPVVLTMGLLIFTALVHMSLGDALSPLLDKLPRTLAAEEELREKGNPPFLAANLEDKNDNDAWDEENADNIGYDSDFDPGEQDTVSHGDQNTRGIDIPIEGADRAMNLTKGTIKTYIKKQVKASPLPKIMPYLDFWTYWITPDASNTSPNFLLKFLHPEIFADYHILRDQIPAILGEVGKEMSYEEGVLRDAYSPPAVRMRSPRLWIPRDQAGVSRQEVDHSRRAVEITDEGAWMDEKGRLSVELESETGRWVLRDWERVKF